jgi:hypothetical protein
MTFITKQCVTVTSPEEERRAQSGGSTADDENIKFHQEPFCSLSI